MSAACIEGLPLCLTRWLRSPTGQTLRNSPQEAVSMRVDLPHGALLVRTRSAPYLDAIFVVWILFVLLPIITLVLQLHGQAGVYAQHLLCIRACIPILQACLLHCQTQGILHPCTCLTGSGDQRTPVIWSIVLSKAFRKVSHVNMFATSSTTGASEMTA